MESKQLDELKVRLEERQQRLLQDQQVRLQEVQARGTSDSADQIDQAADSLDFDLAVDSAYRGSEELGRVMEALQRIDEGNYGLCEACDCAIAPRRLEAVPDAALCIDCKSRQEAQGGLPSGAFGESFYDFDR